MTEFETKARQIVKQLTEYKSIQLVSDCLKILEKEEFYFEDNDLLPLEIAIENYLDKLVIQKNLSGEAKVIGYQALLENLKSFQGDTVHLFTIAVTDSAFIVFFNEDNKYLVGILRTFAQTKENLEKLNIEYMKKGFNVYGVSINL